MDSSRYHREPIRVNVLDALHQLQIRLRSDEPPDVDGWAPHWHRLNRTTPAQVPHIGSAFGTVHCSRGSESTFRPYKANGCFYSKSREAAMTSKPQFDAFREMVRLPGRRGSRMEEREYERTPHMLSTHIFLENNAFNHDLVHRWLMLALTKPSEWCAGHTPEQAAMSMLGMAEGLPLLNPCIYREAHENERMKSHNYYLDMLARGRFTIIPPLTVSGHGYDPLPKEVPPCYEDCHGTQCPAFNYDGSFTNPSTCRRRGTPPTLIKAFA